MGWATFDPCIGYLEEDPWDRICQLKKAMPKIKEQMLFPVQKLLDYRHYSDDVVEKFVERVHINGIDVFRMFDEMNDIRNLQIAVKAEIKQRAMSYTESAVQSLQTWLNMADELQDMGVHSIYIKNTAGLLKHYECEELITRLKASIEVPIVMYCHATIGLSTANYQKAIDPGIDILDASISSTSMTYGHTATETVVSIVEGTQRDIGLALPAFTEIASYFSDVRKKYAQFEGSLKAIDARILIAQLPAGMLTNMESQLKE
jgi:oxaloacetate decarboxylase alpha subunit